MSDVLIGCGCLAVVGGVCLMHIPTGVIVAGFALIGVGYLAGRK